MAKKKEEVEETFIPEIVLEDIVVGEGKEVDGETQPDGIVEEATPETVVEDIPEPIEEVITEEVIEEPTIEDVPDVDTSKLNSVDGYVQEILESKDWVIIIDKSIDEGANIDANLTLVNRVVDKLREEHSIKLIHSERLHRTCKIKV